MSKEIDKNNLLDFDRWFVRNFELDKDIPTFISCIVLSEIDFYVNFVDV